ncbi:NAD-dependent epimerase/dehydratase family protein [Propionimicrobium sp. PCR01-08-3]|uniref:NAD-dependent epimerase/dehydratase family protein n=1 Tax=Propionimicrobium sp. PCR01-08-3 TaxID=3052086 RepID=UPI00333EDF62
MLAPDSGSSFLVVVVVFAAAAVSILGLIEDIRGVPVSIRAALQLVIGALSSGLLLLNAGVNLAWLPLAALFFAANVNFANFMDGVNGISSLQGLVVGFAFCALGLVTGLTWLASLGLILGMAFIAFLPWNLVSSGMFLGDVGSYLLGGLVATIATAAIIEGVHPIAALAPLTIYWADTVSVLVRRTLRGEPIFKAHRSHVFQRLTSTGLSHVTVALLVSAFTLATSALGLLSEWRPFLVWTSVLAIIVVALCYLSSARWRGNRISPDRVTSHLSPISKPSPNPARLGWSPTCWVVVGATGFIGSALVRDLEAQGLGVIKVSAPRVELDPDTYDGQSVVDIAASLSEVDMLAAQLAGADVVINAAGMASPDAEASASLYGANSLLPAVIAIATDKAGAQRLIHLSSAAVQGDRPMLDDSVDVSPFSPYSRSKALGERAFLLATQAADSGSDFVVIRATSVQGQGRRTTESLRRIARSPLASVAAPGTQPTVVSSLDGLTTFVRRVGTYSDPLPAILLQPWEHLTVGDVLKAASGREPIVLPAAMCRAAILIGMAAGKLFPVLAGLVRRVELMWFGQGQADCGPEGLRETGLTSIRDVLAGGGVRL